MSQFIKFYFTSSMLDMFRTLIHPSSGACDFSIVSPHWLCVLLSSCVGVLVWLVGVVSMWQAFKLWHQVGLLFFNYHMMYGPIFIRWWMAICNLREYRYVWENIHSETGSMTQCKDSCQTRQKCLKTWMLDTRERGAMKTERDRENGTSAL